MTMRKPNSPSPNLVPDNTGQEQAATRFKAGQSGNPTGRPRGSRNKLSAAFLDALNDDFEQHGTGVIAKVRAEKPDTYLKVVANLMPARLEAQLEAQVNLDVGFSDAISTFDVLELALLWQIYLRGCFSRIRLLQYGHR